MRIIDLPGSINFRDFGGYPTSDGGRVCWGALYRSGAMHSMTAEARTAFSGLGVSLICDLRRADERDQHPTPFPDGTPRRVHIPIDPGSAIMMREALATAAVDLAQRIRFMTEINRELARHHGHDYRRMLEALIRNEDGGFLVHCTAGKDRTGFAVAVILMVLGVDRDQVIEDYLLTNEIIDFEGFILPRLRTLYGEDEVGVEEARALSGVRREYIHSALEELDLRYGSFARYVREALGLEADDIDRLKQRYLD